LHINVRGHFQTGVTKQFLHYLWVLSIPVRVVKLTDAEAIDA